MTMPDQIQITHRPRTMTTPSIRTVLERLVELDKRIENVIPGIEIDNWIDAMDAARAALKAKPEGQRPTDEDLYDLAAEFNGDPVPAMRRALELWGNPLQGAPEPGENPAAAPAPAPETPAEALAVRPLLERVAQLGDAIGRQTVAQVQQLANQAAVWLRENPPGQLVAIEPRGCPTPGACSCVEPTLQAPEPGEAKELHPLWYLIEFLEGHSSFLRRTDPMDELAQVLSDSATLIKRLASPAYLVVGRPPEGCLEPLKSESGQVEACTAGVSIELLGDAPRPTYLDAIRLAEGCHDYSGGHRGPAMRRALELWGNPPQGAPAPEPQTPPIDEAWWNELINEIARVQYVAAGEGQGGQIDLAKAVELWRRPAALPEPVPVAECPNCGYEGEMVPAPQAGKVEA